MHLLPRVVAGSQSSAGRLARTALTQTRELSVSPSTPKQAQTFKNAAQNLEASEDAELQSLQDILDSPLTMMIKGRKAYPQASSIKNTVFGEVIFNYAELETAGKDSMMGRSEAAITFLTDLGFVGYNLEGLNQARLEKHVTARNQINLFALLVQLGNSLCPEDFAVSHFEQCSAPNARIDHLIVIQNLAEPLNASELENRNPDDLFPEPKKWSLLGAPEQEGFCQVLVGSEDKLNINVHEWKAGQSTNDSLNSMVSKEVRLIGEQIVKYAYHYRHRWVNVNDGNSFFIFKLENDTLDALRSVTLTYGMPIPFELNAKYLEFGVDDVKRGLFMVLFEALEKKFGEFDATSGRWANGGAARGPVSFVQRDVPVKPEPDEETSEELNVSAFLGLEITRDE